MLTKLPELHGNGHTLKPFAGVRPIGLSNTEVGPAVADSLRADYGGGPLLGNVNLTIVFWGSYWKNTPDGTTFPDYMSRFFDTLFESYFMGGLQQYSRNGAATGAGRRIATVVIDGSEPPANVVDAEVRAFFHDLIDRGVVPEKTPNSLYFLYLPPSVTGTNAQGAVSTGNWAAYHFNDGDLYYGVHVYGDRSIMTVYSSHELAEAITDPEPWTGWSAGGQEIGDLCQGSITTIGGFKVQRIWSNMWNACVIGGNYAEFFLQAPTPLALSDANNGDYLVTNCAANADLYFIKRRNTGTRKVEVHVLSRESNYTQFRLHTATAITEADGANGDFLIGSFTSPGWPDLYFVKRSNTGTRKVEVHVLSAASNYSEFALHTATPLDPLDAENGTFALADHGLGGADLFFIKQRNTGSGRVEAHVLSGISRYRDYALHAPTRIVEEDAPNGTFVISNAYPDDNQGADLYFIKARNTATGMVEIHCMSGSSNYSAFVLQTGTAISEQDAGNGMFQIASYRSDNRPDLYFIKQRNVGSGKIEAHVLGDVP